MTTPPTPLTVTTMATASGRKLPRGLVYKLYEYALELLTIHLAVHLQSVMNYMAPVNQPPRHRIFSVLQSSIELSIHDNVLEYTEHPPQVFLMPLQAS